LNSVKPEGVAVSSSKGLAWITNITPRAAASIRRVESLGHPLQVCGVAGLVLGLVAYSWRGSRGAVVVRSDDVQGGEGDAANPAGILRVFDALALDRDLLLAQRVAVGEERLPHERQTVQRVGLGGIFREVRGTVAVGPFVVARRVDERVVRGLEALELLQVHVVSAGGGAALYVAVVGNEGQLLAVELPEQVGGLLFLHRVVGEVPDQADLEHSTA
jgi:hypothetical protein